jgi:hypothetical protein
MHGKHANASKTLIEARRAPAFNAQHGVRTRDIRKRHVGRRRQRRRDEQQARHPHYAEERQ